MGNTMITEEELKIKSAVKIQNPIAPDAGAGSAALIKILRLDQDSLKKY